MMLEITDMSSALRALQREASDKMILKEENAQLRARVAQLERERPAEPAPSPTWRERAVVWAKGQPWKQ